MAYADFMTAMMALFLCLWLTSQDTKIKEAVERAFRNPFASVTKDSMGIIPNKDASKNPSAVGPAQAKTSAEIDLMRHLTKDLERLLRQEEQEESSVQIAMTPDGLCINIFDRSHKPVFNPNTSVFTDYGGWVFDTLAWEIARYNSFHIELEGHTEANTHTTGREGVNKWELSTERANCARRKLVQGGVAPEQIFKVSGFADTVPMPGTALDAQCNRRVTVLLKVTESVRSLNNKPSSSSTLGK